MQWGATCNAREGAAFRSRLQRGLRYVRVGKRRRVVIRRFPTLPACAAANPLASTSADPLGWFCLLAFLARNARSIPTTQLSPRPRRYRQLGRFPGRSGQPRLGGLPPPALGARLANAWPCLAPFACPRRSRASFCFTLTTGHDAERAACFPAKAAEFPGRVGCGGALPSRVRATRWLMGGFAGGLGTSAAASFGPRKCGFSWFGGLRKPLRAKRALELKNLQ
jgi:hypothetical protein